MKERKIRDELFPFVKKLMDKDLIHYSYDGKGKLATCLSSKMYHRYIERGMCLEEMERHATNIPYVSLGMYLDGERPKGGCFFILPKDRDRFMSQIAQIV